MFIARSRSFEEAGFIPIVDLINGSMDSRVVNVEKKTDLISGSGPLPSFPSFGLWHSLRANCIIKKGEELFADYGTTFSHEEQDLAGCLLKYATMAVTRTLSGKDSIKGVKLQMNQVYDDFLPLQKEFLRKFGEFDRADADVGLWLHNSVPRPFNFQVIFHFLNFSFSFFSSQTNNKNTSQHTDWRSRRTFLSTTRDCSISYRRGNSQCNGSIRPSACP